MEICARFLRAGPDVLPGRDRLRQGWIEPPRRPNVPPVAARTGSLTRTEEAEMKASALMISYVAAAALVVGCGGSSPEAEAPAEPVVDPAFAEPEADDAADEMATEPLTAIAVLEARSGSDVSGTITFTEVAEGVRVTGEIRGLEPGPRGFHVHEHGDCSAEDAMSAGGHFNPTDAPHGAPHGDQHHVGDMGNVVADDEGVARIDEVFQFLTLEEGQPNTIVGRSVIVHADEDDLESQPTGDAGARLGCGVIERNE
jgi:superoxide dismutase, Cu-Zn family